MDEGVALIAASSSPSPTARRHPVAIKTASAQNVLTIWPESYYASLAGRWSSRMIDWKSMPKHMSFGKHNLRVWVLQFVLLCFIVIHGFGLFHHHATEAEHT